MLIRIIKYLMIFQLKLLNRSECEEETHKDGNNIFHQKNIFTRKIEIFNTNFKYYNYYPHTTQ